MPTLLVRLIAAFALLPIVAHALPEDWQQEIVILSDQAKIDRASGTVIYTGNVVLTQGTLRIEADRLTAYRAADNQLEKAIAEGKLARYQQQIQPNDPLTYAQAQRIEFYSQQQRAILIGQARVMREDNLLSGEHITYDLNTEVVTAGSNGQAQPSRIRAVIQPKTKNNNGS